MKNCYKKDKFQTFKNISDLTIGALKTYQKKYIGTQSRGLQQRI